MRCIMGNSISAGKCVFCGETCRQQDMTKHLAVHLKDKEKNNTGKTGQSLHIKVEAGPYFLHLLVGSDATFKNLDKFLRDIWLECCGHLSAFRYKNSNLAMARKIADMVSPKMKLEYDYDFGDTTSLSLSVAGAYAFPAAKKIELLSRNEPLRIMCTICNTKPATVICPFCLYDEDAFYCDQCAEQHEETCADFEEETALPVVNSPRMGVCGYTGGYIDKGRDGVFIK